MRSAHADQLVQIAPQDDVQLSIVVRQRDAGAGLLDQHAGQNQPVGRNGRVLDVLVFDGTVRVDQGHQQSAGRLVDQRPQVGCDVAAHTVQQMTVGTRGFHKLLFAAYRIALQIGH